MFWKRKAKTWPIDPSRVDYGSVTRHGGDFVLVRYSGEGEAKVEPIEALLGRYGAALRSGRSLRIEHLRITPRVRRRYAAFFDRLTDWGPARERAVKRASETPVRAVERLDRVHRFLATS